MKKYSSWEDYFNDQPPRGKIMLEELKAVFAEVLPQAIESWG